MDTEFSQNFGLASVGVIARNLNGVVIFAVGQVLHHCLNFENAEA
jgi:hypothetical protein